MDKKNKQNKKQLKHILRSCAIHCTKCNWCWRKTSLLNSITRSLLVPRDLVSVARGLGLVPPPFSLFSWLEKACSIFFFFLLCLFVQSQDILRGLVCIISPWCMKNIPTKNSAAITKRLETVMSALGVSPCQSYWNKSWKSPISSFYIVCLFVIYLCHRPFRY